MFYTHTHTHTHTEREEYMSGLTLCLSGVLFWDLAVSVFQEWNGKVDTRNRAGRWSRRCWHSTKVSSSVFCLLFSLQSPPYIQCVTCIDNHASGYWFKGDPKQRCIAGLINRNGIKHTLRVGFSRFMVYCFKKMNVWKRWKHGHEHCRFMSGSLCLSCHEQGQQMWQKCTLHHEPSVFCLVQSESAWLHTDEFKFEVKKKRDFICRNIDRTATQSLQKEMFERFSMFSGHLAHSFGVPFNSLPLEASVQRMVNICIQKKVV